jgi:hypothetical protein
MGKTKHKKLETSRPSEQDLAQLKHEIGSFMKLVERMAFEVATTRGNAPCPDAFFLARSALDVLEQISKRPLGISKKDADKNAQAFREAMN